MRVIICGSRDWNDRSWVNDELIALVEEFSDEGLLVAEGGCPTGADLFAREWCGKHSIPHVTFPAHWDRYGKSAGPRRNQQMLDVVQPGRVVGFRRTEESRGTNDMLRRAKTAEVEIRVIDFAGSNPYTDPLNRA